MADSVARIRAGGKHFEILVDVDKALQYKKLGGSLQNVILSDNIFFDIKKGLKAGEGELKKAFGTVDMNLIFEKIIKQGEIMLPKDYRDEQREQKIKQVIDFLARNAVDSRTNLPFTLERIKSSLDEAAVNIQNKPIEQQIPEILDKLRKVIPIKIETRMLKIIIPAVHTGKAYGLLKEYKKTENWLANGDLECVASIPAGLQSEFYDKLNSITHGSAITEEIKEK